MRGLFVTGTDTGVGKTVVAAALCAALRARGERVAAFKPVVTGIDDEPDPVWPPDHELLAAASGGAAASSAASSAAAPAGAAADAVAPLRFGPPASPHLAARLAGAAIDPSALLSAARAAADGADVLVAEGVGGLLVPLTLDHSIRDFAAALGLPLVVAARPGLGTINHTLLTLEAARAAGLRIAVVVLTPWPDEPSSLEEDNRATIARLGAVEVVTLACLAGPEPAALAAAAREWPLDAWLG